MTSPFAQTRFEFGGKHTYYLAKPFFAQLEEPKPAYLFGARGSGKTTLLMALNWKERLENETLQKHFGDAPFVGRYIGTYVKLPRIQLNVLDDWVSNTESLYGMVLGLYLDLVSIELIASAIAELLADANISIDPRIENTVVRSWVASEPKLRHFPESQNCTTVLAYGALLRAMRVELEDFAKAGVPAGDAVSKFPIAQIGTFGNAAAKHFSQFLDEGTPPSASKWHFKLCMDEGECLTPFQLRVVNTMIRLAEWPLFPVISFVGRPDDITTTLVPHLTGQSADRNVIDLDAMERQQFKELAEGVATVRVCEQTGDHTLRFVTSAVLGDLSINELLAQIVERSESPLAQDLIRDAKAFTLATTKASDDHNADVAGHASKSDVRSLPLYEAYIWKELNLGPPGNVPADRRRQESAEYRKKMVAAYLSLCYSLGVRLIPYASAEMVLGISDNCVRDFLSQLHELYIESGLDLEHFLERQLPISVQSNAIHRASENKRDSIPTSGILAPVQTGHVIKGLSLLTASLQRSSNDGRHLRSTERGQFVLSEKGLSHSQVKEVTTCIQDAGEAGFLRVRKEGSEIKTFRVHASLAPAYGFSYRGAYYPVVVDGAELEEMRTAGSQEAVADAAKRIAARVAGESEQPAPVQGFFEFVAEDPT